MNAFEFVYLEPAGEALQKGQIWTVAGGCGDLHTWFWLILEVLDRDTANVAPWLRWRELAGPGDVLVPSAWAGGLYGAVSLELESTLHRSSLGTCEGILPRKALEYIMRGRADQDNPARRGQYVWGRQYVGLDRRAVYHDGIAKRIESMQSVRAAVE